MDLNTPAADLIPGARGALLTELGRRSGPVSIRQLAQATGVSPQHASTLTGDLEEVGLVVVHRSPGAHMVSLNREHVAAPLVAGLSRLRWQLVEHLKNELCDRSNLAGAWLFGSAARGDGTRQSDIDVFLVAETTINDSDWESLTSRLVTLMPSWTGNDIQIVEYTQEELRTLIDEENPLITSLRDEGIPLTDNPPSLIRQRPG